jgi:homoserine O-succinyltransferase/O-acetyltransferase
MPLVIGQAPTLWGCKRDSGLLRSPGSYAARADCIRIAFINNMPDAALEDTESQFFELLDTAAGDLPVSVKLFSLPAVPRTDLGRRHLSNSYLNTEDLVNWPFDCVIMTGTEPRHPDLRHEPYWAALAKVLDWAEHSTISTVLSCLAAHAGVLYSDGIERHALNEKQMGVFTYKKVSPDPLTSGTTSFVRVPHSRWNEVRADALRSCGYTVLTQSPEAGVDLFIKKKKRSLFVHFQGHPEYGTRTLLKEYQRDIKRFLRRERDTYPPMPRGYCNPAATRLLADFEETALRHLRVDVLSDFPEAAVVGMLQNTWNSAATRVYSHWLQYVSSRKAELQRSRLEMIAARPITSGLSNPLD